MDINTHSTLKTGLIAYYTLDTNAQDSGPNALHGTEMGSLPHPIAKLRTGVHLNGGLYDFIRLGTSSLFRPLTGISAGGWFWIDSTGIDGPPLVSKYYGTYANWTNRTWLLNFNVSAGTLNASVYGGPNIGDYLLVTKTGLSSYVNNWHHYFFTFDLTTIILYIDGAEVARASGSLGPLNSNSVPAEIGHYYHEGSLTDFLMKGDADEVGFWSRALTPGEITDLYQGGIGITWDGTFTCISDHPTLRSGLLAHYKLDGDLNDATGSYNLTQVGAPEYNWGKNGYAGWLQSDASCGYSNTTMQPDYVSVVGWLKAKTNPIGGNNEHFFATKRGIAFVLKTNDQGGNFFWNVITSGGNFNRSASWGDTNWHLIAGTYNGSNISLYKDGTLASSTAVTAGVLNKSSESFILGAYTTTSGWGATCFMDGFSIYNRALLQSEITDLYNSGNGLPWDTNPISSNIFCSYQSGDWSTPATWGQASYPTAGSVVTVNSGHTIQIDGNHTMGTAPNDSSPVLIVSGELKWKIQESADWTFKCRGSIKLDQGGLLEIGSEATPIPATQKATFLFEKSTSTATSWLLQICKLVDPLTDLTTYGSVSIAGYPSYHMADASKQRTTLAYGVPSGSDRTVVFTDDVDYQVGDTVWIGYGGDPSVDPFNGTAINALYGSDTVTIKTKVDARTYTVDLTYTHVTGDFVIHKTRNVFFGCQDADAMVIQPYLQVQTNMQLGLDMWAGTYKVQWAWLNKFDHLYRMEMGAGFSDAKIPTFKNCIVQSPNNLFYFASYNQWPWLNETVPHVDELHVFDMASNVFYSERGFSAGTMIWGHVSLVDIVWVHGSGGGLIASSGADSRGSQTLEINSLWASWKRSTSFNTNTLLVYWQFAFRIHSMRARLIPHGLRKYTVGSIEGSDIQLHDCQFQHVYGYPLYQGAYSGGAMYPPLVCTNSKFSNIKTGFAYMYSNYFSNAEFHNCDFDGIAGNFLYAALDGSQVWFKIYWKFVNCRIGMMNQNANMCYLENIFFRCSGRIVFENCQIRKPTNVTASGTWTGIKGYCIRFGDSYGGYIPTDKVSKMMMCPTMTYEWSNCQIYDDNGIDQYAIEYPGSKTLAVVGGGGELLSESSVIIDGSFAVKMLPHAVQAPHPGNQARPLRIPLLPGEAVTLKMSLRKNYSLPAGKRPTFNARGCGIDASVEMTDAIDTWEELTIAGTALYEDVLEVWVTGGWNLYAGTTDDFWEPLPLGTIVSYADKFVFQKTAADAPKVISAQSLALNRVRINFNRPMRTTQKIDEPFLNSGLGVSETSLGTGLVAHYRFEGNLNDSTPNALHGVSVGNPLTFETGKIDQALHVDGSGQRMEVASNSLLNPSYISIFAWVKRLEKTSDLFIVDKQKTGDWRQYALRFSDNLEGTINTLNGAGEQIAVALGSSVRHLGAWVFIGMVYDGAFWKLRFNESWVYSTTKTGTMYGYSTPLYVGAYYSGGSTGHCLIDEVTIHNRGLTDLEVDMLWNNGVGRRYTEPSSTVYSLSGGKYPILITPADFQSVDVLLDSDLTPGNSYDAGVIASSGLVDAYGVAFDDANRTANFTCYNSIQTHPTLMDGSLCGAWLLDGDVTDSSGNGFDGTITGTPSFVSGKLGQGLDFAGGASNGVWINPMYLDRKRLGNITHFSVSCWVKFNAITGTPQCILSKYSTESKSNIDNEHWLLYKNTSNYFVFEMNSSGSTHVIGPTATTNWTHLVAGYDGKYMVLYVNGVFIGRTLNNQPRHKPTFPFIPIRFGCCGVDADPPYPASDITFVANAILDQALHFNRLLTADEAKALYNSGGGLAW